jgi:hypothetical protein
MASQLTVTLNVYDLHESNTVLYGLGTGFFHSGVEVNGYEFSFSASGVVRTRPRLPEFGNFREGIVLGLFSGGMQDINNVISLLRNGVFQPGAYDMVTLNCNHFSDAFCKATINTGIPSWVNRLAGVGAAMGNSSRSHQNNSGGGVPSSEKLAAPGVVKSPTMPLKTVKDADTLSDDSMKDRNKPNEKAPETGLFGSVFNWLGLSGGKDGTGTVMKTETVPQRSPAANAAPSSAKKNLTEKQKELLAKLKN